MVTNENHSEEIWRCVSEGSKYQVSSFGNFRRIDTVKRRSNRTSPKPPKLTLMTIGYYCVSINGRHEFLHRVVAKTFIPNTEGKLYVNHKNGVKTDNRVCNLEWSTPSENNLHAYRTGLRTQQNISKRVKQLSLSGELIKIWPSQCEAGRNGFIQTAISDCCKGYIKKHKGFRWEFENSTK